MCGIFGIANVSEAVNAEAVIAGRDRLAHRGPDDSGVWTSNDRRVGLGHRRLSIIDLSTAGHQPMSTSDGVLTIVFNGEVYNFQQIRARLEKIGHKFSGNSDTEVVLASYREWGYECVNCFNGMFAFVIHDAGKNCLFFARDRAGVKPFYYHLSQREFRFSSELKALGSFSEVDPLALNFYLGMGYVPGDYCLFKGAKKLPPAHAGVFGLEDATLRIWKYWTVPVSKGSPSNPSELVEEAESLLDDAVRLRLISDVPTGVLLSGGLDSSLIVASAARNSVSRIKTFSISFPGSQLDESKYSRIVANHFSTEHCELEMPTLTSALLEEIFPAVDEPIGDSSLLPTWLVSKLTRQHVTVALGGDGGDEVFGGYRHYQDTISDNDRFGWLPKRVLAGVAAAARELPAGVKGRNRVASLRDGPLRQMAWGTSYFDFKLRQRVLSSGMNGIINSQLEDPERHIARLLSSGEDPIDSMLRTDFLTVLPDDYLVKVDRASMAVALEMRSPYLDYRLVEFAFEKVPSRFKLRDGESRWIQRRMAERRLPAALDTNRKQGFSFPIDKWFRDDNCKLLRDTFSTLPDFLNRQEVNALIDGQMSGRSNGARLYSLLMLVIALRNASGRG